MKNFKQLITIFFVSAIIMSCGNNSTNSQTDKNSTNSENIEKEMTPPEVAESFNNSIQNFDFNAAKEYVTKESVAIIESMKEMYSQLTKEQIEQAKDAAKGIEIKYTDTEISEDGNTATITVKATLPDGSTHENKQTLLKEDGKWKIQFKML